MNNDQCQILQITKDYIQSNDLNINLNEDIKTIKIKCQQLDVNSNLPSQYRGKNIIVNAAKIVIHCAVEWNLSGHDAMNISKNGRNGENGGNCFILCDKIQNSSKWTIKSNGGNGSSGQHGVKGARCNGNDVKLENFKISGDLISHLSWDEILKRLQVPSDACSFRKNFFENNFEKTLILQRGIKQSKLILLVRGTKGKLGQFGGSGGQKGFGGAAGTVSVESSNIKIVIENGNDGVSGDNGVNGTDGFDGSDAYVYIVKTDRMEFSYFGIDKSTKYMLDATDVELKNSIFYKPFGKFLYFKEIERKNEVLLPVTNSLAIQNEVLKNLQEKFQQLLILMLKRSGSSQKTLQSILKIRDFAFGVIDSKTFILNILESSFDVPFYDRLLDHAKFLLNHPFKFSDDTRNFLLSYTEKPEIYQKSAEICVVKGKILTSDDINDLKLTFKELHVICDVLHLDKNLSSQGINIAVFANIIYVSKFIKWNLSGLNGSSLESITKEPNGRNGSAGKSAGNCSIKCGKIENPSLWSIESNGGRGCDGENGKDGKDSIDGKSPRKEDLCTKSEISEGSYSYFEDGFKKVVKAVDKNNYLLIVKGTEGQRGTQGGRGGLGGMGGQAGKIQIQTLSDEERKEIKQCAHNGQNGKDGQNGRNFSPDYTNGFDAVLFVENGQKNFIGLGQQNLYTFCSTSTPYLYSLNMSGTYYSPQKIFAQASKVTIYDDLTFFENLIIALRHTYGQFNKAIEQFRLADFSQNKISLRDVAKAVAEKSELSFPYYPNLKALARNYKTENLSTHNGFQKTISEYIKPVTVETKEHIVIISKKIMMSKELSVIPIGADVKEVKIFCDTLIVNTLLPDFYRGRNLSIVAKFVDVLDPYEWNLSGKEVKVSFSETASQDADGNGLNGSDGNSGKNGGNFYLKCEWIENAREWTIKSNGTDGTNGQNGGDGKDGKNGKNASEFIKGLFEKYKGKSYHGQKSNFTDLNVLYDGNQNYNSVEYKEHGLKIHRIENGVFYIEQIVLMIGEVGKAGMKGGVGGYGGVGGLPGEIIIDCDSSNPDNEVKIIRQRGKSGKNGINGTNGLKGRDGDDAGYYHVFPSSPIFYGTNGGQNLSLVRSVNSSSHAVYCRYRERYISIEHDSWISSESTRQRNNAELTREKSTHAQAQQGTSINVAEVIESGSFYLVDTLSDVRTQASMSGREYQATNQTYSERLQSIRNAEINIDAIVAEHSSFLNTSADEKVTDSYKCDVKESVVEEAEEVCENVHVNHMVSGKRSKYKKMRKLRRRCKREVDMTLTYDELMSPNADKTTEDVLEFLKHSELNNDQYEAVISNLEKLNISDNEVEIQKTFIGKETELQKKLEAQDLMDNSFGYLRNLLKTHCINQLKTIDDVERMCEEKQLSLCFAEIFRKVIKSSQNTTEVPKVSRCSRDFPNQFSFLKVSKNFNTNSNDIKKYFLIDLKAQRTEILDYFKEQVKKSDSSLAETLLNYLEDYPEDYDEISKELNDVLEKIKRIDEQLENRKKMPKTSLPTVDFLNSLKLLEIDFSKILAKFFETKKVKNFIEDSIKKFGIQSGIYKCILTHKLGVKLTMFRNGMNNELTIFEDYNYYDRRFTKEQCQEIVFGENEFFILSHDDIYSTLDFDFKGYKNMNRIRNFSNLYQSICNILRDPENNQLKVVENIGNDQLERLNGIDNKLDIENIKRIIQRFNLNQSLIENLFQSYDLSGDTELLIESLNLLFADKSLQEEVETGKQEIVHKKETIQQDNSAEMNRILAKVTNENEINQKRFMKHQIKWLTGKITMLNGVPILRAVNIQVFNNNTSIDLEDVLDVLKTVFLMLTRSEVYILPVLWLIMSSKPDNWIVELILMELSRVTATEVQNRWRSILNSCKMKNIIPILLRKLVGYENDQELTADDVTNILENFEYFEEDFVVSLTHINLNKWVSFTTEAYWEKSVKKLTEVNARAAIKSSEVKILFENLSIKYGANSKKLLEVIMRKEKELNELNLIEFLENFVIEKWTLGDEIFKSLKNKPASKWIEYLNIYFNKNNSIRTADAIVKIIKSDGETSKEIKDGIDTTKAQFDQVFTLMCKKRFKKIIDFNESEIEEWIEENRGSADVIESLAVIYKSFILKLGINLRDTQLMAVLMMWNRQHGALLQVSTGEGKTFIAVAFAITKVLKGERVDIVSSSKVLAERDSIDPKNLKIFNVFKIKVDHNCYDRENDRAEAYRCPVVYGTLSNFQRDYLLTQFFSRDIISSHFQNILVDEVDSMLLDKGNNILYLSQDLPDLDEMEGIFVFIWNWVNQNVENIEDAMQKFDAEFLRKMIFDISFGVLEKEDILKMYPEVDADEVIKRLKSHKMIDDDYTLIHDNCTDWKIKSVLSNYDSEFVHKMHTFIREKVENEKMIQFPRYMKSFVSRHLDTWIQNALRALHMESNENYVVDRFKGSTDNDPNVNILDLDTGTDLTNSAWDGGLHQFIQLKFGCKLSPLSLKSVFISNVTFFKKYKKLFGMTGTLGSAEERHKITNIHEIVYVTVPRFKIRKFIEYTPICERSFGAWEESLRMEVQEIVSQGRTVLIICETILATEDAAKAIKNLSVKTTLLQRESDNFDINSLECERALISTNLAGRGTDIKLSKELEENGGLHVILTYLPNNSRIEDQAFGRSARAGQKGSGRIIFFSNSDKSVSELKRLRNNEELQRLDEISLYYKNFITTEEYFLKKFENVYKELEASSVEPEIYTRNILIQWSLWQDENSKAFENWRKESGKVHLEESFERFINSREKLHPIMRVKLYKVLMTKKFLEKTKNFVKDVGDSVKNLVTFQKNPSRLSANDVISSDNLESDIFAHEYIKLYEILRKNQVDNSFEHRELYSSEVKQILKCIQIVQSIINRKEQQKFHIKNRKVSYMHNASEVKGYEDQQSQIIECYSQILEGLKALMGYDVHPGTLETPYIKTDLVQKDLYDKLMSMGIISHPKVRDHYELGDDLLKSISRRNQVKLDDLKNFLSIKRQSGISSLKALGSEIQQHFQQPNRMEFWKALIDKKILKNETEYVFINGSILSQFDPSAMKVIEKKFVDKTVKLIPPTGNTIWLTSVTKTLSNESLTVIKMEALKKEFSHERINFWAENDGIEFNRVADFDIDELKRRKSEEIFEKFNKILTDDFKVVSFWPEKLTEKLIKLEILISKQNGCFGLNYNELEKLSDLDCLADDFVYLTKINDLIHLKFSYSIALQKLVESLNSSDATESVICLDIDPHLELLNDLIYSSVIELAKVKQDKIINCESIFSTSDIKEIFRGTGIHVDEKLIDELKKKRLIFHVRDFGELKFSLDLTVNGSTGEIGPNLQLFLEFTIAEFDSSEINLSSHYEDIELTVKLMLQNRRVLQTKSGDVKNILTAYTKPLLNRQLNEVKFSFRPIDLKNNNFVSFMATKGINMIITIEQATYTTSFWIGTTLVFVAGLLQIAAGIALTIMTHGFAFHTGSVLISEGINDIGYAFSSLRTGTFSWKAYGKHKVSSVIKSIAMQGFAYGLSKFSVFKGLLSKPSLGIGGPCDHLSGIKYLRMCGDKFGEGALLLLQTAGVKFAMTVLQAGVQNGLGMGIDYLLKNFTNSFVYKFSKNLIEKFTTELKKHEIMNTFSALFKYFKLQDLFEIIKEQYNAAKCTMESTKKLVTGMFSTFKEYLSVIKDKITERISMAMTIIQNITYVGLIGEFIFEILNKLNVSLKVVLRNEEKKKIDKTKRKQETHDVDEKFTVQVAEYIKDQVSQELTESITDNIVRPMMTSIGYSVTDSIGSTIKSIYGSIRENKITKEAQKLLMEIEEHKRNSADGEELPEYIIEKAVIILSKTKNPDTYKLLMKENIPMDVIGTTCVSHVINKHLEKNVILIIEHGDQELKFGDTSNENAKKVTVKLKDGHYLNSNSNATGNDCLYYALTDQIPELKDRLSADEFRSEVIKEVDNPEIQYAIQTYDRRFYRVAGLYGGRDGNQKRRKLTVESQRTFADDVGQYNTLKSKPPNDGKVYQVHHCLAKGVLRDAADEIKELQEKNYRERHENVDETKLIQIQNKVRNLSIRLEKDHHCDLESTYDRNGFMKFQSMEIKNGNIENALGADYQDQANKIIKSWTEGKITSDEMKNGLENAIGKNKIHVSKSHEAYLLNNSQRDRLNTFLGKMEDTYLKSEIFKGSNKNKNYFIEIGNGIERLNLKSNITDAYKPVSSRNLGPITKRRTRSKSREPREE